MPNVDRKLLPYPDNLLVIHKPILSGCTPAFCNVGLVPGSVVTLGNVPRPTEVGKLEVRSEKLEHIQLLNGYGFLEMEGVDGVEKDCVTFRAATDYEFFVLERHDPVKTLYDAAVPTGSYSLHMLSRGQTIQLRAGDMILPWHQHNVHFGRASNTTKRTVLSSDMQSVILVLPYCPDVNSRDLFMDQEAILKIWKSVFDFMQCWQFTRVANSIVFTIDDATYSIYAGQIPASLLAFKDALVDGSCTDSPPDDDMGDIVSEASQRSDDGTNKRKMDDAMGDEDDDSSKKQRV